MFSVRRGLPYIQLAAYAFTEGNTYTKHEDTTHAATCVLCEVGNNV
jgi:hypothetical protein